MSRLSRVLVLATPASRLALAATWEAARKLAVALRVLGVRRPKELGTVLATPAAKRADALVAISDPVFRNRLV